MSDKILNRLIKIYANNKVKDVEDNKNNVFTKEFNENTEELFDNDTFNNAKEEVKEQKQYLETNLDKEKPVNSKSEVIAGLRTILDYSLFENKCDSQTFQRKIDILAKLIKEKYGERWNSKQHEHFDFLFSKFKSWNFIFISYTNQGAFLLNDTYQKIIKKRKVGKGLKAKDRKNMNLLAEAMVQIIKRRNYPSNKIFYDKKDIKDGDDFSKRIIPKCRDSFVFVQLVTEDTFISNEKGENWSFREYKAFKEYRDKNAEQFLKHCSYDDRRFQFAIGGNTVEAILPDFMNPDYNKWLGHISDDKRRTIISKNTEKFTEAIVRISQSIKEFLVKDLIESVPE